MLYSLKKVFGIQIKVKWRVSVLRALDNKLPPVTEKGQRLPRPFVANGVTAGRLSGQVGSGRAQGSGL